MAKIKSRYLAGGAAGAALIAAAVTYTTSWEGTRLAAYRDSGGVWTICTGHTGPEVHAGLRYTQAQCDAVLQRDIVAHEARLLACAPVMADPAKVPGPSYIAINDWAFNVGSGAACSSTLIRKLKAGDLRGACNALSSWVYVNHRVLAGLVNRRVNGSPGRMSERALCLEGVR